MTNKEAKSFNDNIKAVQDTMYVIGGKWKLPIILSIYQGNKRFNEIASSIPKITNRVLSKELKHLEDNFLIKRTIVNECPVKIEYTVIDYTFSLHSIIKPMEIWGKKHKEKIKEQYF